MSTRAAEPGPAPVSRRAVAPEVPTKPPLFIRAAEPARARLSVATVSPAPPTRREADGELAEVIRRRQLVRDDRGETAPASPFNNCCPSSSNHGAAVHKNSGTCTSSPSTTTVTPAPPKKEEADRELADALVEVIRPRRLVRDDKGEPTPLAASTTVTSAAPTKFCRECGAKISRTSKYCKECGKKLVQEFETGRRVHR